MIARRPQCRHSRLRMILPPGARRVYTTRKCSQPHFVHTSRSVGRFPTGRSRGGSATALERKSREKDTGAVHVWPAMSNSSTLVGLASANSTPFDVAPSADLNPKLPRPGACTAALPPFAADCGRRSGGPKCRVSVIAALTSVEERADHHAELVFRSPVPPIWMPGRTPRTHGRTLEITRWQFEQPAPEPIEVKCVSGGGSGARERGGQRGMRALVEITHGWMSLRVMAEKLWLSDHDRAAGPVADERHRPAQDDALVVIVRGDADGAAATHHGPGGFAHGVEGLRRGPGLDATYAPFERVRESGSPKTSHETPPNLVVTRKRGLIDRLFLLDGGKCVRCCRSRLLPARRSRTSGKLARWVSSCRSPGRCMVESSHG